MIKIQKPSPEQERKMLQQICEAIEARYEMTGLSEDGGLYSCYAKDVARCYLEVISQLHEQQND